MKFYQPLLLSIGALALAGSAFAQVPAKNDTSDTSQNTGMGTGALGGPAAKNNGSGNTASGFFALTSNTTGNANTASGASALQSNTTGRSNTAIGVGALQASTTGNSNTASGDSALGNNTIGGANTADGSAALLFNTTGSNNSALGYQALYKNKTGGQNTASGVNALYSNVGNYNTATGYEALYHHTSGTYNIALGWQAGFALTTGSHNIDIANPGESTDGLAADSGVIRIGTLMPTALQTLTYIAGIYDNTSVSGLAVVIDSDGQLGTVSSSERFKTAIAPMGSNMTKLQQLRPVTFRYKADPQGTMRYGLIAEAVAKVYPELVIRDRTGRIDGIRYDELAPILLNEVQHQAAEIRDLKQQQKHFVTQAELKDLKQELQAALTKQQAQEELVANR
jgi:hypothetical protein